MVYLKYIQTALEGAKYHEDQAFFFETTDTEYSKVSFHIRAYFWELYSIWDYILQHANTKTLRRLPHEVRGDPGSDFITKIENEKPQYKYIVLLKSIRDNPKMKKIKLTRNYAHKWQYNPVRLMASIGEHPREAKDVLAIGLDNSDKKEKNLRDQILIDRSDLLFMEESVQSLVDQGFFEY